MTMPVSNPIKILAFDTSSKQGSVALLEGSDLSAELKIHHLQNHSAHLIRSIDFLLECLGWTLKDINLVAAGIGPGSFTGIRIGIATGLGLAQSLHIPFVGISGLEALAFQVTYLEGSVGVLLNAHREQVYYTEYRNTGSRMCVVKKPKLQYLSELQREIKNRHMYLIGESDLIGESEPCGSRISNNKNDWPRPVKTELFLAAGIGRRAVSVKRRWRSGDFIQCEPLYIRPPDAMKNRNGGH